MFSTTFLSIKTKLVLTLALVALSVSFFMVQAPQAAAQARPGASLSELEIMLQTLLAQIAALTSGANNNAAEYEAGDKIITTNTVNVRATGSIAGQVIGVQRADSFGTISDIEPVYAGNYTWYRVNFDSGVDGWVASENFGNAELPEEKETSLTFSVSENNPDATTIYLTNNNVEFIALAYEIDVDGDATKGEVTFDRLSVSLELTGANFNQIVEDIFLRIDGQQFNDYSVSAIDGINMVSFDIDGELELKIDETTEVEVVILTEANVPNNSTIKASVSDYARQLTQAEDDDDVTNFQGRAIGNVLRLITEGNFIVESIKNEANAEGENGELGDFTFEFEVTANDEDIYIKDSVSTVGKSGGIVFAADGPGAASTTGAITSSAERDRGSYVIREGETENFTVNVWLKSTITGNYRVAINTINYNTTRDGASAEFQLLPKEDFRSPVVSLTGQSVTPVKYEINVYSPLENQSYKPGDTVMLEWKTNNLNNEIANVTLFGNNTERHVLKNIPLSKGTASFKIPASDSLGTITSGDYMLHVWVTGLKDGDPKNVKDSVKIKIGKGTITPVLKPTPRFVETVYADEKGNTKVKLALESIKNVNDVTGPVVLGSINWGDGTVSEPISALIRSAETAVTVNHVYKRSGNYEIVVTAKNGETITQSIVVNRVSPTPTPKPLPVPKPPVTTPKPILPTVTGEYTLIDVTTITKKVVDPSKTVIDDEYTLYTITLKSKKTHLVKVFGNQQTSMRDANFKKTGYTGDVAKLLSMAKVVSTTPAPTPVVKGATTDIYGEISVTLRTISEMLEEQK